jgi:putative transposase
MVRLARVAELGVAYHVTQRGNNRQDVFFVDDDRRIYLEILKKESKKYRMEVHGYCLMTNHVHIVARPKEQESLAKALGRTHFRYTTYVNRMHGRSGHLWQNRFFSCPLDEEHYRAAILYMERNPVRAKMVRKAWDYEWSSAAAHTGMEEDTTGLLDMDTWNAMIRAEDWKNNLAAREDKNTMETIRLNTRTGRPLGSDNFISKLETKAGRRLRPLPHGRPRKNIKSANKEGDK